MRFSSVMNMPIQGWYIPIGEASASAVEAQYNTLKALEDQGLRMSTYRARYYYNYEDASIAPQTVGYVLSIPKERLEEFQRLGYRGDEKVGSRWHRKVG